MSNSAYCRTVFCPITFRNCESRYCEVVPLCETCRHRALENTVQVLSGFYVLSVMYRKTLRYLSNGTEIQSF